MQFAPHHVQMIDDARLPLLLNLAQASLKLADEPGQVPKAAEHAGEEDLEKPPVLAFPLPFC